jgi:class 3 adenylate cyclase
MDPNFDTVNMILNQAPKPQNSTSRRGIMNERLDPWLPSPWIRKENNGSALRKGNGAGLSSAGHERNALYLPYLQLCLLCAQLEKVNNRLTHLLQRFIPQEVARKLITSYRPPRLGGQERQATILFADARGYTAVAEAVEQEQVLNILNAHLHVISEAVRRHGGTLVQYAGDMAMAAFNAPDDQPDHPLKAARAALDVRDALERFTAQRQAASLPVLGFGIGLSTGPVVAGYVGVEYRYEYAVMGDTTNVAFHLCARAEAGQILISQMALDRLGDKARVIPLGPMQLKRRRVPVPTYELGELVERPLVLAEWRDREPVPHYL